MTCHRSLGRRCLLVVASGHLLHVIIRPWSSRETSVMLQLGCGRKRIAMPSDELSPHDIVISPCHSRKSSFNMSVVQWVFCKKI